MGYLDNSTVTVDAILTNKGRQILAAGGQLNITKFAVADDEIDYDLWNPSHTLGSNYYGAVIEAMPIVEALPDETQLMRYKLVTLPKDVISIPVVTIGRNTISITAASQRETITPTVSNLDNGNSTLGYTAILSDDTVATLEVVGGTPGTMAVGSGAAVNAGVSVTNFLDDEATGITTAGKSITRVGMSFEIKPVSTMVGQGAKSCLLTLIGNETGGFKTVTVTVNVPLTNK
jgi:hypothetical protein